MQNNPFRSMPTSNAADWGKTKFKPSFGGGKQNFQKHGNRKFDGGRGNNFNKNKGISKFNEVANGAKPDNATKWTKFKDEIVYKQREKEQAGLQADMDSHEAKMVLKQREMNYRRSLIQEKKQEPTEWEDFGLEVESNKNNMENKKYAKDKSDKPSIHKTLKQNHVNKSRNNTPDKLKQSKTKFNKNVKSIEMNSYANEFISKELLQNFDSKKLNYKQNDKLRSAITKTAIISSGSNTLESVVKDMKRKAMKKEKLNKQNIH